MGKLARNKQRNQSAANAPSLSQINSLTSSIASPFLKQRAETFIEAAQMLIEEMRVSVSAAEAQDQAVALRDIVDFYGKQARTLDLILSIAGASNHLSAQDKVLAQKIRMAAEQAIGSVAQTYERGTLRIVTAAGPVETQTHSAIGRRIASLFAKFVPAAEDVAETSLLRDSLLPQQTGDRIKADLVEAKKLVAANRPQEAAELYQRILKTDRKNAEAIAQLGSLYMQAGQFEPALTYMREALRFYPDDLTLRKNAASALHERGEFDEAIEFYRHALRAQPKDVDGLIGIGLSYLLSGDDEKAKQALDQAESLAPNRAEPLSGLGAYHQMHNEIEKAGMYYSRALKIAPNHGPTLFNFGILLSLQQKLDESIAMLDRALQSAPDHSHYLFNKGMLLLAKGDYAEGWKLYEHGRQTKSYRKLHAEIMSDKPLWDGKPAPSKRLLIVTEQGLGDAIQFIRYAALCKERVGKVHVLCPPPLVRLFKTIPFVDKVFTRAARWDFDLYAPVMSLPHLCGTTLDTIPATVPYLHVPPAETRKWAGRLALPQDRLKVGLVWSGGAILNSLRGELRAQKRNLSLAQLKPLLDVTGVAFYSLQMGEAAKQIGEIDGRITDAMGGVKDMLDTAAIIENLDLVITVDTSVSHLAGALGKPVWVLSRFDACWRWLGNRADNPWYPSARIFGQPKAGDWDSVIAQVAAALKDKAVR